MRSIRSKKFFGATPSRGSSGQAMIEYLLILLVVTSMFMLIAKPFLTKMGEKFKKVGQQGFFTDDPSGSAFYYFKIK